MILIFIFTSTLLLSDEAVAVVVVAAVGVWIVMSVLMMVLQYSRVLLSDAVGYDTIQYSTIG